jgi:hypothetical protein
MIVNTLEQMLLTSIINVQVVGEQSLIEKKIKIFHQGILELILQQWG